MAGGKATPRQKMINMMYLVLTAMLALNVSAEVLEAFVKIETGLDQTIRIIKQKNAETINEIGEIRKQEGMEEKAREVHDKASAVHGKTVELSEYLQNLKVELVNEAENGKSPAVVDNVIQADTIQALDNKDAINRILLGVNKDGKAYELRTKVEEYRKYVIQYVADKPGIVKEIESQLNFSVRKKGLTDVRNWEQFTFENTPLISGLALLSKIQVDILNSETSILTYLKSQIGKTDFKISSIDVAVNNPTGVILRGGSAKAEVFLVAYDKSMNAQVSFNGRTMESIDGKTEITLSGSTVGQQVARGKVSFRGPDDLPQTRDFEVKYQVIEPSLVVSPTKMNVFYLGVDNPIDLSVAGVPIDNVNITCSNGVITGTGTSRVFKPQAIGECSISVTATISGTVQNMGTRKFRVKRIPDPVPAVFGIVGKSVSKGELASAQGVIAKMPQDFDFDYKFNIKSFTVSVIEGGYLKDASSNGPQFTQQQRDLIKNLKGNSKVIISDIKAQGPDGERQLLDIIYNVR